MPRFSYSAIDSNKKAVKGTVSAESSYAARKHLRAKGLHPTNIKEIGGGKGTGTLSAVFKKSSKGQVVQFTKQLSTMLNAGIKLTDALNVLILQVTDANLKNTIADIRDRVVTGESFADALGEYDNYFDVIFVNMVRVGEVTGTLGTSLNTIATFMEKRSRIEAKVKTAMIYPAILVLLGVTACIFLTINVIPTIAEQFIKTGQQLPWITQVMLDFSYLITSWKIIPLVLAIVLIIWAFKRFFSTQKGAWIRDSFILSLPKIGSLVKQHIIARFSSTLSTLLGSGLSISDSLRVVAEVTGNTVMYKAVKQARERILSGSDIATPLRDSGVIDPATAHMVAVGEKSGELEQMLKMISDNLEESSDLIIDRLMAALMPIIIIIMAGMVALIAIAAFLPMMEYSAGQF